MPFRPILKYRVGDEVTQVPIRDAVADRLAALVGVTLENPRKLTASDLGILHDSDILEAADIAEAITEAGHVTLSWRI